MTHRNQDHREPTFRGLDCTARSILATLLAVTAMWGCGPGAPPPVVVSAAATPEKVADLAGFDPVCSGGIVRELRSRKGPVTLYTYVSKRTPELERAGVRLVELARWFERAGEGKVVVEVREANTEAELQEAVDRGLQLFDPKDERRVEPDLRDAAVCGIAFESGGEKDTIPVLRTWSPAGLRGWVASQILGTLDRVEGRKKTIGVVGGKGEIKLSEPNLIVTPPGRRPPSMLGIATEALPFYSIEEIDLHGGVSAIRPDLAGLLITQPGASFTEQELRRIDELVLRGTPLVVLASAVNLTAGDVNLRATLDTRSLDKLLTGYGIEMRREALFDWGGSITVPVTLENGGTGLAFLHGLVVAKGRSGLEVVGLPFFKMDELAFPFPSPLVPHPDKQPEATMKVLARSSTKASAETPETLDLKPGAKLDARGALGAHPMAIQLRGKIRSAFGAQGTAARGRLMVVSSSEFLANPFARARNSVKPDVETPVTEEEDDLEMLSNLYAQKYLTATILTFKNILDWMALDEELVACFEEQGSP